MNKPELTYRAARWCEAAGIPRPDEIEDESHTGIFLSWWIPQRDDFEAVCEINGRFDWNSWNGREEDEGFDHRDSASMIAAIKKEMDA